MSGRSSPEDSPVTPGPDDIEVGAAERGLRYWVAKEAVRQGETRLGAQNGVRTALEARATAITGWAAVGFLAVIGAGFTAQLLPVFVGSFIAGLFLFASGAIGIIAARPRAWSMLGYEPDLVLAMSNTLGTELEALEAISGGLADGITVNNARIDRMGRMLRWAGWLLICAPLAGAAGYKATSALCGWPAASAWVQVVVEVAAAVCPRRP